MEAKELEERLQAIEDWIETLELRLEKFADQLDTKLNEIRSRIEDVEYRRRA